MRARSTEFHGVQGLYHCLLVYRMQVGSKKCPAALSSTVMTGVQMASGYLIDVLCFHKLPKVLTVCGACMMLLAVLLMASTRLPRSHDVAPLPHSESNTSLASFVASEYAERVVVRHRSVAAQVLGASA